MAETSIGKVTHYFDKLSVAVIKLDAGCKLEKGAHIHIKGHATDFTQEVTSLQADHADIESVKTGDDFGIKVNQPVREGDMVCRAD